MAYFCVNATISQNSVAEVFIAFYFSSPRMSAAAPPPADGMIRIGHEFTIDGDLEAVWTEYTTENEEKSFRKFVNGFVKAFERQVSPNWELLITSRLEGRREDGPATLPDELLPALR